MISRQKIDENGGYITLVIFVISWYLGYKWYKYLRPDPTGFAQKVAEEHFVVHFLGNFVGTCLLFLVCMSFLLVIVAVIYDHLPMPSLNPVIDFTTTDGHNFSKGKENLCRSRYKNIKKN